MDLAVLLWNIVGFFVFMPFSLQVTLLQSGLTVLSIVAATVIQAFGEVMSGMAIDSSETDDTHADWVDRCPDNICPEPCAPQSTPALFYAPHVADEDCNPGHDDRVVADGNYQWRIPKKNWNRKSSQATQPSPPESYKRVVMHFSEYCASASFLLIAVLILFVPGPYSWASIVGFTGVLLCNLAGIVAHYCKLELRVGDKTHFWSVDWTKDGNHFKLFLMHSWIALLVAVFAIIYLGWNDLTNSDVPAWVRFLLWNLLVTYTTFGLLGTVCYWAAGSRDKRAHFDWWIEFLDTGLTVLSILAKLPVAFTVFYGLQNEPDGNSC